MRLPACAPTHDSVPRSACCITFRKDAENIFLSKITCTGGVGCEAVVVPDVASTCYCDFAAVNKSGATCVSIMVYFPTRHAIPVNVLLLIGSRCAQGFAPPYRSTFRTTRTTIHIASEGTWVVLAKSEGLGNVCVGHKTSLRRNCTAGPPVALGQA